MKQLIITLAVATALTTGLAACQRQEEAPAVAATPAQPTVVTPEVNITVPPAGTPVAGPTGSSTTTTDSTTVNAPDPITGAPGSVTSTTTTTEQKH